MNVHEVKSIETKSILSRLKSKDNYWGIAYNMNLYRGCQHGCIYCDTRSCCYGIGDISHISVKPVIRKLVTTALWLPIIREFILSATTTPPLWYLPPFPIRIFIGKRYAKPTSVWI